MFSFTEDGPDGSGLEVAVIDGTTTKAKEWSDRRVFYHCDVIGRDSVPNHTRESQAACQTLFEKNKGRIKNYNNEGELKTVSEGFMPPDGWAQGRALSLSGTMKFMLSPYTEKDQVHAILLCGMPGSGKSTAINSYATEWTKLYPHGEVLLISDKPIDRNLKVSHRRVDSKDPAILPLTNTKILQLQRELFEEHPTRGKVPFLVIFDDTATLKADEYTRVYNSIESLIRNARDCAVSVIYSTHVISDSAKTGQLHPMATHTFYFSKIPKAKLEEAYKDRARLKKPVVDFLVNRADIDRWVCVSAVAPQLVITPTLVTSVDALNDRFIPKKTK
jgi:hypothetical protein